MTPRRGRSLPATRALLGATLALLLAGCTGAASGSARTTPAPTGSSTSGPGPAGDRASVAPTSSPTTTADRPALRVVGLGDSVMSGSACGCQPFLTQYAGLLATREHRTVTPVNLGAGGLTAPQLADQLTRPAVAADVSSAGTVVVTIGANDLVPLVSTWEGAGCDSSCVQPPVSRMRSSVAQVLARIGALVPDSTLVLVTDYWNVFEDGDVADADEGPGFAAWSDGVTVAANAAICAEAASAGDTCVDLYHPFLGADGERNPTRLLAEDGDHPNDAGHTLIAEALLADTPRTGT